MVAKLTQNFAGNASRTRCFTHIINLIAKSLLKQFDVPKKGTGEAVDEAKIALHELAEGLDLEEIETRSQLQRDDDDGDGDDDDDQFEDAFEGLSSYERVELSKSIRPVSVMLVKVRLLIHQQEHLPDINLTAS
jgi:hypothetical protein